MKNLNIKWKIMLPVYFVICIFFVGMVIQYEFLDYSKENVKVMHDKYFQAISKSDELKLNIVQVQQWLTDISATRGAEGYDDGFDEAEKYAQSVRSVLDELKTISPEDKDMLDGIGRSFEPYYETGVKMANAYIQDGPEGGNQIMEEFDTVSEDLNNKMEEYVQKTSVELEKSVDKINRSINMLIGLVVVILILVLLASGGVRAVIGKQVIRPIRDIKDMAKELEKGNLSITNDYKSEDEIGELAAEMGETAETLNRYVEDIARYMKEIEKGNLRADLSEDFKGDFVALRDSMRNVGNALNEMMGQIHIASDGVAGGAEQVANGAQMLADGSVEQAQSIERLQDTIITTSDNIIAAAATAQEASEKVHEVGTVAKTSNEQMHQMLQAMENISQSSDEIGKIIKTIEDIAFQTNILALNAAVEAARAGEAGKGFAVVADEVRNLASKSAEAAKNTTTLIEGSIRAVENGSGIANMTAESMNVVVSGVQEVVKTIGDISEILQRQTSGIETIKSEIGDISAVTQRISSTAEENGMASEELSGQSDNMKVLVNRFQLKNY